MHTLPRCRAAASSVSHPVANHEAFQNQPACALVLRRTDSRNTSQFGDPSAKDTGAVKAGLERGLAYDPGRGVVIRVAEVGPHAAKQHRHLTFRRLDSGWEVVLVVWFLASSGSGHCRCRHPALQPVSAQGDEACNWCRGKAGQDPERVNHARARVPTHDL
ncbi:hypothetical protein [Belnapia rosea]|nr:hypothetical protein [Belnapia rosea]